MQGFKTGKLCAAHLDKNAFILKSSSFSNTHLYVTSLHQSQMIIVGESLPSGNVLLRRDL